MHQEFFLAFDWMRTRHMYSHRIERPPKIVLCIGARGQNNSSILCFRQSTRANACATCTHAKINSPNIFLHVCVLCWRALSQRMNNGRDTQVTRKENSWPSFKPLQLKRSSRARKFYHKDAVNNAETRDIVKTSRITRGIQPNICKNR